MGLTSIQSFSIRLIETRAGHWEQDVFKEINEQTEAPPKELDALAEKRLALVADPGIPRPSYERIFDHIDHVVNLVGVDHVGLGSDLDVIPAPVGMEDVTDFPKITEGLPTRGYSEEDIAKILGGNFLRVLEQVTDN